VNLWNSFSVVEFSHYSLLKYTYVIFCLSYYSKKNCYKHRQKKTETIHTFKKERERESNRHRDIQKTKKIKLWIMIIPMMDMENRQTFNKKRHRHTYIHIKSNSKRLCSRVKRKCSFIFCFLNRAKLQWWYCSVKKIYTRTHTYIKSVRYNSTSQ
jgi:hypothetical protein